MNIQEHLKNQLKLSHDLSIIVSDINTIKQEETEILLKSINELKDTNEKTIEDVNSILENIEKDINSVLKEDISTSSRNELLNILEKIAIFESKYPVLKNTYTPNLKVKERVKEKSIEEVIPRSSTITNEAIKPPRRGKESLSIDMMKNKSRVERVERLDTTITEKKNNLNSKKSKQSFEFNLGKNGLNVIGIVLILIALITFGRYVYVNMLSDVVKGISLFIMSALVLGVGQIVGNKNKWLSNCLTALGISSFYISIIINFLFLETLSIFVLLPLVLFITGVSIYISIKDNSNLIRIMTLIGANLCLLPTSMIQGSRSFLIVAILLSISAVNVVFSLNSIKKKNFILTFENYSIIITLFFMFIQMFMFDKVSRSVLALGYLVIYNFMFIKKATNRKSVPIWDIGLIFIASVVFELIVHNALDKKSKFVIYTLIALVELALFIKSSVEGIKLNAYANLFAISLMLIDCLISLKIEVFLIFMLLTLGTYYVYALNRGKIYNKYYEIIHFIIYIYTIFDLISPSKYSVLKNILYIVFLIGIVFYKSIIDKNSFKTILTKYFSLILANVLIIGTMHLLKINLKVNFEVLIFLALNYIAFVAINKIDILRSKTIKKENVFSVIALFLGFFGYQNYDIYTFIICVPVGLYILIFYFDEDYLDLDFISQNAPPITYLLKVKPLIYSLFGTASIISLSSFNLLNSNYNGMVSSILLISLALLSICFGFKYRVKQLRLYGLLLSLIVCAKLTFIDFYYLEFMAKTLLFLIVGIIALVISYIYNKLESELKDEM